MKINRREFVAGAALLAGARPAPPEIWNLHCHLPGLPGRTGPERVEAALRVADRLGVSRLIFFMGMEIGPLDPAPEALRRYNDDCLEAIRPHHPRVLGFVYISGSHPDFSVEEIDRCVRDGPMVGVKLWVARRCNAPELDPIVRRAVELKAPIYQHTWLKAGGNPPGESTPFDLVELAARHPEAKIVCGHAGGDWERGIRAVRASPNVSLELAGFDPTAGVVEMGVRELGAERLVWGSDSGGRSVASQLAKVAGADVPEEAKRLMLGANLRRLLKPILDAKGFPS